MATFYVDPINGNDSAAGSQLAPLKTLAAALVKSTSGTTIKLANGSYTATSGEKFPLVVKAGVTIVGDEATKGKTIIIQGGGTKTMGNWPSQNITMYLEEGAQVRGVTVTNPGTSGVGVWIHGVSATLANSTLSKSSREGVFASGIAKPTIITNVFAENTGNGMSFVDNAKGEVRGNLFQKTGFGLTIGYQSAPLLKDNQILENRTGIVINGEAAPVLRNNIIEKNEQDGITVTNNAKVDLGTSADPAGNTIKTNGQYDVQNASTQKILSIGNTLSATTVKGDIDFVVSSVPVPEGPGSDPEPEKPTSLKDIAGHWAAPFITAMVGKGLIAGFPDGTYKPEEKLTRAQYAAIVAKAFNETLSSTTTNFTDVASDFWGKEAIVKANRMGFIAGFPDVTFRPNDNLTRVQALVSLASGLKLSNGDAATLGYYTDRAQIPSYATNAVAIATEKGMVVNYPNVKELNPMREITRAEVAAIIYQGLVVKGLATAIPSSHIVAANVKAQPLSDIAGHWAAPFILGLYNAGAVGGYPDGTFKPNDKMTRAQYAALVTKALNPPVKRDAATFKDVAEDFWGYVAVQTAYKSGFISGFPDNTFKPAENVQRAQVIVSLVNGLGLSGGTLESLTKFSDRTTIPDYAKEEVATALLKELIVSYPSPDKLEPTRDATRAEVAVMIYQALVNAGKIAAIDSQYILSA
ncbi:S-layer homology domain-containing protein [Laspinema olomoucense]|uniref:S-layer homology domain-containing protein n=1 Tax=Laspinema olomoucense TaxID=3231600 RepID=UPI0021BA9258|nr:S-layer homology domain-containing protein [Laspinema sp. D3a]MCT7991693.1 S-layer homology domain-containing protein [Laspinema sp. D3a]